MMILIVDDDHNFCCISNGYSSSDRFVSLLMKQIDEYDRKITMLINAQDFISIFSTKKIAE